MRLDVNGKVHELDAPPEMPLLWALRDLLSLTGTKFGCGAALCGACTVLVDGEPARACVLPLSALSAKKITTIEAVGGTPLGKKAQDAWIAEDVPQVRLLPVGPDRGGGGAAERKVQALRRGHHNGAQRQPVPLWHPHPDPQGDTPRRRLTLWAATRAAPAARAREIRSQHARPGRGQRRFSAACAACTAARAPIRAW
jgi:2Fe-2S iron-sulfur cluster binding domain